MINKSVLKSRFKKYWLPLAVVIAAIIRVVIVMGLSIHPMPKAACDDLLLKNWAFSMLDGDWTGKFTSFTFIKEVGFSIFLAVCSRLHISYLLGVSLTYTFGAIIFSWAFYKIISNKYVWFFLYIVILFNPLGYAAATVQRVYRNGLGLALALWVFGCILNLYFSILDEKVWKPVIWSVLSGASLGFLWIVKSDTIWLLPFAIVVLLVSAGLLLFRRRKASSFVRAILLIVPLAGILASTSFVSYMNVKTYGSDGIPYYGLAFQDMTSTKQDVEVKKCSMTRATFKKLCKVSPTLDSIKKRVLKNMDFYDQYDTQSKDGNVEDGWLGWAFVTAVESGGYYKDGQTANAFYQNVYEELENAYRTGVLVRKPKNKLAAYHMDTAAHRVELLQTMGKIFGYVASFQEVASQQLVMQPQDISGVLPFETITRNHAVYPKGDHDYYLSGWLFYPGYDLSKLNVYVEDNDGSQFQKIEFAKSADVGKLFPDQISASNCRFAILWNSKDHNPDTPYYICTYADGKQIGKVAILPMGFDTQDSTNFHGTVDTFINYIQANHNYDVSQRTVNRLNIIASCYKGVALVVNMIGMIAYFVFTITFFLDIRKKHYENVNAWLIVTGMLLSLLVLFFGIAVTNLEQCPTIEYMYLGSGYALLIAVAITSIYHCVKRVLQR